MLPREERGRVIGPLVGNVSLVATLSVALLVATGTFAALIHLNAWSDLWTTLYGRVLAFKLALVAVLLVMGFVNRQAFVPRYRRTDGTLPQGRYAIRRFRGLIAAEVLLMAVVLAATGALAGISPQEESVSAARAQTWEAEGREFQGVLSIQSLSTGINAVELTLTGEDGEPLTDVKAVKLQLYPLDKTDVPPVEAELEETAPGVLSGNATFGFPGEWAVTAVVQREAAYDDSATFFVNVPG